MTKNVNFLKNCWSDRSENLQVGAQYDFEKKLKFEEAECMKNLTFWKNEKNIPFLPPPPYNAQQSIYGTKKLVEHANNFPGKTWRMAHCKRWSNQNSKNSVARDTINGNRLVN